MTVKCTVLSRGPQALNLQIEYGENQIYNIDLLTVLAVPDVIRAFQDHPGEAAIYSSCLDDAISERERLEAEEERFEGQLYEMLAKQCKEEGLAVGLTEKTVKARMASSRELHDCKVKVLNAKSQERRFRFIVEAYNDRKDLLVSLGAHLRHQEDVQSSIAIMRSKMRESQDSFPK